MSSNQYLLPDRYLMCIKRICKFQKILRLFLRWINDEDLKQRHSNYIIIKDKEMQTVRKIQ